MIDVIGALGSGVTVSDSYGRTWKVSVNGAPKYIIKKVSRETFAGRGFIILEEIPGWTILRSKDLTFREGNCYEIIDIHPGLAESAQDDILWDAVVSLCKGMEKFKFLSDIKFTGIDRFTNLISRRAGPLSLHYHDGRFIDVAKSALEKIFKFNRGFDECPPWLRSRRSLCEEYLKKR
jgi:hypothetical protein